jgi:hypothetical protein
MRNRSVYGLCLLLLVMTLALPSIAQAQTNQNDDRDKLWNGVLIGAGVGAAVGMFVLPQYFCGAQDTECSTIVRATMGLISIGAGIGIGALVDGLQSRDGSVPFPIRRPAKPRLTGMQLSVRF